MSRNAGFTLIEMMIALVLIAILATIATPSLRDLIKNARMTAQANDLMADLAVARAEAVKRGGPTALCTSNNGTSCTNTAWNEGWIIFTDNGTDKGGTLGVVDDSLAAPDTDVVIKRMKAIDGWNDAQGNTITSTNHEGTGPRWVGFRPSGVVRAGGGGPEITFDFCDSRNQANAPEASNATNRGRRIRLSGTGRALVVRCTCASLTVCNP